MIAFTAFVLGVVLLVERAARRKNARNHIRRMAVAAARVRQHPPRSPRARGRSASRGYFPWESGDDFPSNLGR
jgi:hypothetical protein